MAASLWRLVSSSSEDSTVSPHGSTVHGKRHRISLSCQSRRQAACFTSFRPSVTGMMCKTWDACIGERTRLKKERKGFCGCLHCPARSSRSRADGSGGSLATASARPVRAAVARRLHRCGQAVRLWLLGCSHRCDRPGGGCCSHRRGQTRRQRRSGCISAASPGSYCHRGG